MLCYVMLYYIILYYIIWYYIILYYIILYYIILYYIILYYIILYYIILYYIISYHIISYYIILYYIIINNNYHHYKMKSLTKSQNPNLGPTQTRSKAVKSLSSTFAQKKKVWNSSTTPIDTLSEVSYAYFNGSINYLSLSFSLSLSSSAFYQYHSPYIDHSFPCNPYPLPCQAPVGGLGRGRVV